MAKWCGALADGVRRMQSGGLVDRAADPERIAVAILAAIQGGLILSRPERAAWPLETALDVALGVLYRAATDPAVSGARAAGTALTTP